MLVLGGLLFGAVLAWNGGLPLERQVIEIPRSKVAAVVDVFRQEHGRSPDTGELRELIDALVDQEILFQYALELGLQEDPTAQRRLALIAQFVAANPHESIPQAEGARRAEELGLHQSDVVFRRILADGARRLIRAVVLTRQPTDEMLETYRLQHAEEFMRPGTSRITQVMVNALAHGEQSEQLANQLMLRIEAEQIAPADAIALGDEVFIPGVLPPLSNKDLERRFGTRFVAALQAVAEKSWAGPLRSRYGYHVVFLHERRDPLLPPLAEIEEKIRRQLLHEAADDWLDFRLQQLRAQYDIVIPEIPSS